MVGQVGQRSILQSIYVGLVDQKNFEKYNYDSPKFRLARISDNHALQYRIEG